MYHDYWQKDNEEENKEENVDSLQSSFNKETSLDAEGNPVSRPKKDGDKKVGNELQRLENLINKQ